MSVSPKRHRTFKNYHQDYGSPGFFSDHIKMFYEWVRTSGFIKTIYSQEYTCLVEEKLFFSTRDESEELEKKAIDSLWHEMKLYGFRTDVCGYYHRTLKELNREFELEKDFIDFFLSSIAPLYPVNVPVHPSEIKPISIEGVLEKFETYLRKFKLIQGHNLEWFLEDFKHFLGLFANAHEEFGFAVLERLNAQFFSDIALLIYSKTHISDKILLYQIGDAN